eukprot:353457-Chlamydomonas_euryale.AAC.4
MSRGRSTRPAKVCLRAAGVSLAVLYTARATPHPHCRAAKQRLHVCLHACHLLCSTICLEASQVLINGAAASLHA